MPRFDTLHEILPADARLDRQITFIHSSEEQPTLTFRQLRERACAVLGVLQRSGLQPGHPVLLFVGDNRRFVEVFWACVLGGMVPVPLAAGATDEHLRKLLNVFAQFEQASVVIDPALLDKAEAFAAAAGRTAEAAAQLRRASIASASFDAPPATPGIPRPAKADDLAFIQFSSGSTGTPKGVLLTHRNLTANIASMIEAGGLSDRDSSLSWMPLSHDMGLIGFHLKMLACGAEHAIMRTELFARRPLLWLELASERRATLLSSPNFGYQHYLRQYALRPPSRLDLSAVRIIYNGAEPISALLCRRFVETLAAYGLRPNAMLTVYGLAEATLAVSFPRVGAPLETIALERSHLGIGEQVRIASPDAPGAAEFVKVGRPVPGTEVRITDDAGVVLGQQAIGHVEMRGENVTSGYHGAVGVRAAPRAADGWFDTGDLGLFADDQLVITGRAKDLFIVNGQNHYPHDLERIAEQAPGIETNRVVAAGVRSADGEAEELALFVLHRSDMADLVPTALALRRVVAQQTGLEVAHIVPVTRIPKTSSGKLQRYALAQDFESGSLDAPRAALAALLERATGAAGESAPAETASTLVRLRAICARIVPDRVIGPDTDLLAIDLNSLSLARIHEAIDREFPQRLEITDLLERPTLAQWAQLLDGPV